MFTPPRSGLDRRPRRGPLPFASPPNDIDKALDALADAIRQAEDGERKSMAAFLMGLPARSRIAKILAQLPSSQLMAFLERHRPETGVARRPRPGPRCIRGRRPRGAGEPLPPRHDGPPAVRP